MSRTASSADSPLERQELGLWPLALLVLVQGERRDVEYSLLWSCQLTDAEHTRRDQVMSWFSRLGLLEAGAPHFCLTRRGRAALATFRMVRKGADGQWLRRKAQSWRGVVGSGGDHAWRAEPARPVFQRSRRRSA